MRNRISIFILLLFIASSCEKISEIDKGNYLFKITVINQGDTGLVKLNVYASIFYPNEQELLWLSASKWRAPEFPERDYILHDYDSVQIRLDSSVYYGCRVDLLIGCHYRDKESNYHIKNINIHDTVETDDGLDMRFTWPVDTFNLK